MEGVGSEQIYFLIWNFDNFEYLFQTKIALTLNPISQGLLTIACIPGFKCLKNNVLQPRH